MPHRPAAAAVLGLLLPALVACGAGADGSPPAATAETDRDDHGTVAGAAELAEPALGLTSVDPTGSVRHLDLLSEEVRQVAEVGPVSGLHTDGRYAFAQVADGVAVVDSGVWTWDHVDHLHFYRAEARDLGVVRGEGDATVATSAVSTSGGTGLFFAASGEVVRLDNAALADGALEERLRVEVEPHGGMAVPVGEHTLVTEAGPDGAAASVVALDADGDPVPGSRERCADARGTTTTRVGAVVGCADGALVATSDDGRLRVEHVPYPDGAGAPPATSFSGRDGRPTVAGLAGDRGVWLLDTRERSWSLLRPPRPLVQVTAVDDDAQHVLGLTRDGRVAVLDGASGDLLATSRPLVARSLRDGPGEPVLVADQQRAYLSAPAERRLHEIDFADRARVSRSFTTGTVPAYVAGTGR